LSSRMRRSLLAALAAAVLLAAAPAGAATLHGRILGRPQLAGTHARVPLLLDDGTEAVVTVPARSGFRTVTTGRSSADRTRLGDAVTARVRRLLRGRGQAKYLKIVKRSAAPAFADLDARLGASSAGVKRAVAEIGRISAAEATGPQDHAALRHHLLDLRYQLNLLIADLRGQADGMDRVRGDLDGVRRAEELVGQLRAAAGGMRSAAGKLEHGVTGLDEFINAIGGSGAPLPVGSASTVGAVLDLALQVLDGLDLDDGLPGTPALPDPLGGVPVPPLPPVLPG
jgi:hypothetical protein